ncbi:MULTISPECIES: GAF domain-containing protein [unclassified Gordonia (in: high G+C Gram-positive bacteria)]|uniref:helix-turn-helix domain-containing protein n=1 Tax=unclassified Gordonia (in: high G+C Gram-positive bacteria) TaxID=2657482 RepID=UPI001F0E7314|nr:GAF domain-containing protein [Gordonia sp. ABSL49_1]MCH5642140.1 GAF domain-containing protein [Gordonia sp. ABSL49_1]
MTVSADPPSTLVSREREVIAAFAQVTTEAITDAKLEDLLTLVGRRLCALLGVTRCSVYLRHGNGRYRGAAGYCQEAGDITQAVKRQESGFDGDRFSQEVITTRQPVVIRDALNDPRPHHRTMAHWDVRAMLGVPLVFDDEVIGVIFVDSRGRDHEFTADDIELATLFARLSALFISQAMLNTRLRRQAAEIARNNSTLAYLADVHKRLTNAVLEGANIGRVVGLLSELSAKPVVLYNNDFDVLAWAAPEALRMDAPPIISAKVRNTASVRATLAELSVNTPSAVVPAQLAVGLGRRHLMCRMVIEGKPSGFLGIVEVGRSLESIDANIAERGATVLALQMLSERRQIETEGQARDDYLSDLLRSGRDKEHLVRRGPQFGIDLTNPHVLVRFTVDDAQGQMSASAIQSLVTRTFSAVMSIPAPPAVRLPGAVIVMVRLSHDNPDVDAIRTDVSTIADRLAGQLSLGTTVISGVCRVPTDFPHAHRELRDIGSIARSFDWGTRVVSLDDLGLFRVVVSSGHVKEALHFAHSYVAAVRDHDDGTLLATWRAFVAADGKVQATAQALDVHENTIRYRLGRIREICRQDPTSLDSLLSAKMAFQVLELSGE